MGIIKFVIFVVVGLGIYLFVFDKNRLESVTDEIKKFIEEKTPKKDDKFYYSNKYLILFYRIQILTLHLSLRDLIIIEGTDCVGKTTFLTELEKELLKSPKNKDLFTFYREPKDSPSIYNSLMSFSDENSYRDFLLVFAARFDLWLGKIKDDLKQNKTVFLDRSVISTFVYQYFATDKNNRDKELLSIIHTLYENLLKIMQVNPKYFVLDAPENVICERMTNRKEGKDRFEQNLRKSIKVYRETIQYLNELGWNIKKLDASKTTQEILSEFFLFYKCK